ncbi:MAG: hypothetical protein H6531_11170 [Actinobacteria bacterium]|nr:hypothetical protein [Thermoleophilia bacterium]MCB9012374.1 hypothetical protein [Actinomycetota bacterium]
MTTEPTGSGWAPFPGAPSASASHLPPVEPGRIVGLGAICDLRPPGPCEEQAQDFAVSEFATLDDGRRVLLHAERGFTIGWRSAASPDGRPSPRLTAEDLTRDVLTTVLPDGDAPTDDHPWAWLAGLARARGLDASEDALRGLPYEVVFTDAVTGWLADA